MKSNAQPITVCRILLRTILLLSFPLFSYSQTFFGAASNPADGGAKTGPTTAVVPPALMVAGDLVILYGEYRATGATMTISATGGQTWSTATTYSPGSNQTIGIFWCRFNGTWGASPSVTIGAGTNGLSAIMYVFRPSNANALWDVHINPTNTNSGTNPNTITGLTTTVPNTVTMAFWSSGATNTWGTLTGAGWSKTGLSAQYRNTTTGQSHTAAYNINTVPATVANVSQTQSAATTALKSIMSWFEVSNNNLCGAATLLTSATSCVNTIGTVANSTYTATLTDCSSSTPTYDVWYLFVAQSTNPTITLSSIGAGFNTPRLQLFSGACGGFASLICGTTSITASGLTIGNTYYVRAYSLNGTAPASDGAFNICIDDPAPANDDCTGAITLTSATSCVNTTGSTYGSTLSGVTITTPNCASSVVYDVWYSFVAQTTNPTITLSSIGAGFTNPAMQLLSNNCGGTFIPYFCGTTSIAADFLDPGTTYYIRVYSSSGTPPTSYSNGDFDICVVDPVATAFNDECANAIYLPIGVNTCSTIPATIAGATASAVAIAPCTGPVAYDVWYKFKATSNSSTITIGGAANNFTNRRLQILSGNCGSLTSAACGTSPLAFASTAGTTYYVRVYSTTGPPPNGNADFTICVNGGANAPVRFGNSYVNISKRTNGGVVQPGDTLEIRMTINHTSGTMTNLRYVDNVPTKTTMLTTSNDSIRIITNEGLTYKRYTVNPGINDDAGTYKASPGVGEYNIRLNVGFNTAPPGIPANNNPSNLTGAIGQMNASTDRPRGGGGMLFAVSYRVRVTGIVGDTITLFPGQFIYNNGSGDITLTATSFKILINNPLNLCTNSIGINNAVENGGTFGSGTGLNRGTDLTTPIVGYTFVPNVSDNVAVNDGRYAIVKNLSPRSSSVSNARRQPNCSVAPTLAVNDPLVCANRMFGGFWFIDGDHSGTNNAAGNPPPATTTNSGYMLMVNADYVASEVYRQDITNLCPNTYYEFSGWIKNICPTCGIDSAATSTYRPGVFPNLTFALNDVDYYNSGQVDTLGWLKKGFVFKTGASQTSATFSIRNNSQGGGGNDWAMDDIAVATCFPNMTYSPTYNPTICQDNQLTIYDTVRSYFDNYVEYKWQRSTNGGSSWNDISGSTGTATPVWNGSAYQYIRSYAVPPSNTTAANDGDLYRLVVASSTSNLSGTTCSYTDPTSITIDVLTNCGPVLKCDLLSFNGNMMNANAILSWTTSREDEPVHFVIEKSNDGTSFTKIGSVNGHNNSRNETNSYSFIDPSPVTAKVWYRVILINTADNKKYSRIITLNRDQLEFTLENVLNPFNSELTFNVVTSRGGKISIELIDIQGKNVKSFSQLIYAGSNSLNLDKTGFLPPGVYTLRVQNNDKLIVKKVMKKNN